MAGESRQGDMNHLIHQFVLSAALGDDLQVIDKLSKAGAGK
jgi:hypothetical protein